MYKRQPAGLLPVIAVRKVGIARIYSADKRIDRFIIDVIVQVARRHRPVKAAPAILDLLVLGDGIQDQRQQTFIRLHHRRQRGTGLAAFLGVRTGQRIQDLRLGDVGPLEREPQRRGGFIEQPHPGAAPAWRAFSQHALHIGGQHMRRIGPHPAKPGHPVRQRRHRHKLVDPLLRHQRQFKLDKQQH